MKKFTVLRFAALALALSGCKSKQDQLMELNTKLTAAGNTYLVNCPLVNDQGQPDAGGHPNTSPECVEEKKHYDELQQKYMDAQREASK